MPNRPLIALAAITLAASAAIAQSTEPSTRPAAGDVALTIYSTADPATMDVGQLDQLRQQNPYGYRQQFPGYGVVRETRRLDLPQGRSVHRFTGVAAGIDPTTVQVDSLGEPVTVVEQSYEYDLLDATKLLEKFVGQTLSMHNGVQRVKILSVRGDSLVYEELPRDDGGAFSPSAGGIRIAAGNHSSFVGSLIFPDTAGLILEPTLVWNLHAESAGERPVRLTYQTTGLTWRADYSVVAIADDTAVDVSSWVTLVNQSGVSFDDATLKLVAGDVQRVQPPQPMYGGMMRESAARNMADVAGFEEKAFFEYHLYTLGRPTSLGDNSTKQIELFESVEDVPAEKVFVYYGLPAQYIPYGTRPYTDRDLGIESNTQVDVYLRFDNAEEAGLGIPMPAGKLRVYKKDDADDTLEFVGEDVIGHTPREEEVLVKLGSAFDLVGERRQTDFTIDTKANVITESFEIKLRNRKAEPATVLVKETLFRWANWEIVESSHDPEKQDARTVHFPVTLQPDEEAIVTYTVRYTW